MNNFIDCTETIKVESIKEEVKDDFKYSGETIKKEDIKGEINEEESDKNPLSIHQVTENSIICEDVKEEERVDEYLQEIESSNVYEDVKEELNEEENVEVYTFNQQVTENSNVCEDVKEEIEEEESVDDPLSIQEGEISENVNISTGLKEDLIDSDPLIVQGIHNTGDEENNTVVDNIDIVQHKIYIDN